MTIRSSDGERDVPADEFLVGVYVTAVGEGELLTRIAVPLLAHRSRGRFRRRDHRSARGRIANAAATTSPDGVRIALGCGPRCPFW